MIIETPLKVLSLYEGFFVGGARILHSSLVKQLHGTGQEHTVLSLTNRQYREFTLQRAEHNFLWKELQAAGVKLIALDRDGSEPLTAQELSLVESLIEKNDVVLSLKEQPLEIIEGVNFGGTPLVVCLHRSDPEHQGSGPASLLRYQAKGLLSRVVCVAHAAKQAYSNVGLHTATIEVITNGVDLNRFQRDESARARVREEFAIAPQAPVVMLAARFDEMKNVPLFLSAAQEFQKMHPQAHFIMCGMGLQRTNPVFAEALREHFGPGDDSRIHALGVTSAVEDYYSAADIISLTSSFGEAYPLCLLEAMACGAVPVSTAVGDTALMVDGRGVVTAMNAPSIAQAWGRVMDELELFREKIAVARPALTGDSMVESYRILLELTRGESSSAD